MFECRTASDNVCLLQRYIHPITNPGMQRFWAIPPACNKVNHPALRPEASLTRSDTTRELWCPSHLGASFNSRTQDQNVALTFSRNSVSCGVPGYPAVRGVPVPRQDGWGWLLSWARGDHSTLLKSSVHSHHSILYVFLCIPSPRTEELSCTILHLKRQQLGRKTNRHVTCQT